MFVGALTYSVPQQIFDKDSRSHGEEWTLGCFVGWRSCNKKGRQVQYYRAEYRKYVWL